MTRAYLVGRINGRGWTRRSSSRCATSRAASSSTRSCSSRARSASCSASRARTSTSTSRTSARWCKFLKTILPLKRVSELFTVLGRAKQGKTERYRELFKPPAALRRPVRAGAGRARARDDLLHAALVRRGVQADPRQVSRAEEHPARGRAVEVRTRVQARPRRPPRRRAGIQAHQVPEGALLAPTCSQELQKEAAQHRARRRRRAR